MSRYIAVGVVFSSDVDSSGWTPAVRRGFDFAGLPPPFPHNHLGLLPLFVSTVHERRQKCERSYVESLPLYIEITQLQTNA